MDSPSSKIQETHLTVFMRICQELFQRLLCERVAPGATCDPGLRDRSRPTRIARRQVSLRPTLLSNVSTCLWEQPGNTGLAGSVSRALSSLSSTGVCFQRDLSETWRAVCVGNGCKSFFISVSFGWPCVKANVFNICTIINNVQMECSFRHNIINLLFSAFLKQSSARIATTIIAAGPVQQNLRLHARWEDCPCFFFLPALAVTLFSLLNSLSDRFGF